MVVDDFHQGQKATDGTKIFLIRTDVRKERLTNIMNGKLVLKRNIILFVKNALSTKEFW